MELIDGHARIIRDGNMITRVELRIRGLDGVSETSYLQFALTPEAHHSLEEGLRLAREGESASAEVVELKRHG